MNELWSIINLLVFIQIVTCRDFYIGMFRRDDFLVAQDVIYKAPEPFGYTTASYGRSFKCPITYFRVVDRLGMGRGPITTIVRGGLRKKFITVRIKSTYRLPISVNIYVGCENKKKSTLKTTLTTATSTKKTVVTTTHAATKKTSKHVDTDVTSTHATTNKATKHVVTDVTSTYATTTESTIATSAEENTIATSAEENTVATSGRTIFEGTNNTGINNTVTNNTVFSNSTI